MTEIKSTMDLINEKLRGLEITAEEKQDFRKARMKEAAQELYQRYFVQDHTRNLQHMMRELQDAEPGVTNTLALYLITRLSPDTPSARIYEALSLLLGTHGPSAAKKLETAAMHYQQDAATERRNIEQAIETTLNSRGISGTAVAPHAESDNHWLDIVRRLEYDYTRQIQELVAELGLT